MRGKAKGSIRRKEGKAVLARVYSCALTGLSGTIIEVEVDNAFAEEPKTIVVGLPDTAVQESKERVRSAIRNSGLRNLRNRVTVNLAPADLRKEGPCFDLPIAIGELACSEESWIPQLDDALIVGELSLDGSVRHIRGVLLIAAKAREMGFRQVCVPACDAREAALIPGIDVLPVHTLLELYQHFTGVQMIQPLVPGDLTEMPVTVRTDFSEIKGQEHVKRALEIAAAGSHNVLMSGSPGTGKTLLARALPSILPRMTLEESLDVTRIYSIEDLLPPDTPLIQTRPFRAPHHTVSYAGLVGGGNFPRPGEISLAHRGVLFLDEFPEFDPRVLEVLRQPLEDKVVTISRATGSYSFPANFMLVAAMNPCPCGYYGDPAHNCTCSETAIRRYQKRISGPLLDRIDIHVNVPRVDYEKLSSSTVGEPSEKIRKRVEAARELQRVRFARTPNISCNSEMAPAEIRKYCSLDPEGEKLIKNVMVHYNISARVYHRLLKLARTIADLDGSVEIRSRHIAEAIQYRPRSG